VQMRSTSSALAQCTRLEREHHHDGEEQRHQGDRADSRMNRCSYHSRPLARSKVKRVMIPPEGNPQIDEDALGDLTDGDVDLSPRQPEERGQNGDEHVGIDRVRTAPGRSS